MSNEPIDLEDLQAVAELSRLSWEPNNEGEWFTRDGLLYGHYSFDVMDSDYIEAVPPSTVLALIAELLEARATIAHERSMADFADSHAAEWQARAIAAEVTIAKVRALAYLPDSGDMYADSAIVVDATVLQKTLEGRAL